jgi:hypothetical protein
MIFSPVNRSDCEGNGTLQVTPSFTVSLDQVILHRSEPLTIPSSHLDLIWAL